jgi:serine protease Do
MTENHVSRRVVFFFTICTCLAVRLPAGILVPVNGWGAETENTADLQKSVESLSHVMRTAAEKVMPAVIHLETRTVRQRSPSNGIRSTVQQIEETGSGFVILLNGKPWVMTNRHVVAGIAPESMRLLLPDYRKLKVTRVLLNIEFDLALLEINEQDVPAAVPGDSDKANIADIVLVLGSPFGLSQSVSMGILSGKNRRKIPQGEHPVPLYNLLQTDAAVNPGNSGGPLVNIRGEVIGIVTAIASSSGANEGVGFAIPINEAVRLAEELIATGKIMRPSLGIELAPEISPEERDAAGLVKQIGTRVTKVSSDSPAAKAGIQPGDIIVRYQDSDVENDAHLVRLIVQSQIGESPAIVLIRGKAPFDVKPVLAGIESR